MGVKKSIGILILMLSFAVLPLTYAGDWDLQSPNVSQWDVWKYIDPGTKAAVEQDIYPGTTQISILIDCPRDQKDFLGYYFLGHVKQTGNYELIFYLTWRNQYNKWNHWVGWVHFMLTDPYDLPKGGDVLTPDNWHPVAFAVPRQTSAGVQTVSYTFQAVKLGDVYCFGQSHCVKTDVNGDGKVNILDVAQIAKNYGRELTGKTDPLYVCDMDCDFWITRRDINLVCTDFGMTIPP